MPPLPALAATGGSLEGGVAARAGVTAKMPPAMAKRNASSETVRGGNRLFLPPPRMAVKLWLDKAMSCWFPQQVMRRLYRLARAPSTLGV